MRASVLEMCIYVVLSLDICENAPIHTCNTRVPVSLLYFFTAETQLHVINTFKNELLSCLNIIFC